MIEFDGSTGTSTGSSNQNDTDSIKVAARAVVRDTQLYGVRNWPIKWLGATKRLLVRVAVDSAVKTEPVAPSVPTGAHVSPTHCLVVLHMTL